MDEGSVERPPLSDRSGVTDGVRVQMLATEHWSLLATRSMIWNEIFARAGMFLTVLSAAVVALALVAQATEFGREFRLFAFLVLPVVLLLVWATYLKVNDSAYIDLMTVVGMNRLRRAYLDLAPELEPYFTTAHHDDVAGVLQTLALGGPAGPSRVLTSTPLLVGIITGVVAGVIAGFAVETLGGSAPFYVAAGIVAGFIWVAATFTHHFRGAIKLRREYHPRFPGMDPPHAAAASSKEAA
jgi:hypothetical protein